MSKKARVIALYLPQFHPIPENDQWWGKGFTEWTNVGKAKPLFKGHYQPKVPSELGYYDLRIPEVRESQAKMAREAGVEGFMYWHYWFGKGKTLLERPFQEVLNSGKPDFPFCLGWANHSWENKTWDSNSQYKKAQMLMPQEYHGKEDYISHFNYVLPAFKDKRYITIDGKPIFLVYAPLNFPEMAEFIKLWNELAIENGLKGVFFIGSAFRNHFIDSIFEMGFNAVCRIGINDANIRIRGKWSSKVMDKLRKYFRQTPLDIYNYADIVENLTDPELDSRENIFPAIVPNFDHSPRSGRKGLIYVNSTPKLWGTMIDKVLEVIKHKKEENKVIFLRSWNEWAEGNYVEPDLKHGREYLDILQSKIAGKDN